MANRRTWWQPWPGNCFLLMVREPLQLLGPTIGDIVPSAATWTVSLLFTKLFKYVKEQYTVKCKTLTVSQGNFVMCQILKKHLSYCRCRLPPIVSRARWAFKDLGSTQHSCLLRKGWFQKNSGPKVKILPGTGVSFCDIRRVDPNVETDHQRHWHCFHPFSHPPCLHQSKIKGGRKD